MCVTNYEEGQQNVFIRMKLNASKWNKIEQETENQCDVKCSPYHNLQNML